MRPWKHLRPWSRPSRWLTILTLASAATGVEIPSGILAISAENDSDTGGSAVVISADGDALTLGEAVAPSATAVDVVCAGGRHRRAIILKRDPASSAVLLHIVDLPSDVRPLVLADSRRLQRFDPVWTAGNASGGIALDGAAAISRGVISGFYEITEGAPLARGRGGRILAGWLGAAIETDAAINDGSHGGALLDDAGHLIGLTSRAQVRERRLPLSVPLARILDGLSLPPATAAPAGGGAAWRRAASAVSPSLGLLYLEKVRGPGNPEGVPRPPRLLDEAAAGERERLGHWWELHWQQQQVFYTDQPVTALSLGNDLLLTAASNLHGGAERGRLLLPGGALGCTVIGRDLPLDLALLRCERAHGLPAAPLAEAVPALGAAVALLGRHREGDGWTATLGTVSATERRRQQSRLAFLQTDARANYGSLGGPLIDSAGRVVGLCVLLGPQDDRPWLINSGVALAVDVLRMTSALPAMREGKTTIRPPLLGLGVVLRRREGQLVINEVTPGTGAAAADMRSGDLLLAVDGKRATSPEAISRVLIRHQPGERIPVLVRRDDAEMTLIVELTEFTP
jgi:S1-C subfamily serine protease